MILAERTGIIRFSPKIERLLDQAENLLVRGFPLPGDAGEFLHLRAQAMWLAESPIAEREISARLWYGATVADGLI